MVEVLLSLLRYHYRCRRCPLGRSALVVAVAEVEVVVAVELVLLLMMMLLDQY